MATAKSASITKMEAVRKALAALGNDAMPGKIQEYVEKTFGMEMTTGHVSNYKSALLRPKSNKKTASPRPTTAPMTSAPAPVQAKVTAEATGKNISLEDVETVKGLVGRVGEGNLKSLIDLLG